MGDLGSTNGGRRMDERKKKKIYFLDDLWIFEEISFFSFFVSFLLFFFSYPRFIFSTMLLTAIVFVRISRSRDKFFDDFENSMGDGGLGGWMIEWGGCSIGTKVIAYEMNPVFPVVPLTRSAVVYDKTDRH